MKYRISTKRKIPKEFKLSKVNKPLTPQSLTEVFPVTKMMVGNSLVIRNRTAHSLKGTFHHSRRTRGGKFRTKTFYTKSGFYTLAVRVA